MCATHDFGRPRMKMMMFNTAVAFMPNVGLKPLPHEWCGSAIPPKGCGLRFRQHGDIVGARIGIRQPHRRSRCLTVTSMIADDGGHIDQNQFKETQTHFRLPYIGFMLDMIGTSNNSLQLARRYGPVYRSRSPVEKAMIVSDLDAAHVCLSDAQTFRSKGAFNGNVSRIFSDATLTESDGAAHLPRRKMLSAGFSPTLLKRYFDYTLESAHMLFDNLELKTTTTRNRFPFPNRDVDLDQEIRSHFCRVSIAIATSLPVSNDNDYARTTGATMKELTRLFKIVMDGLLAPPFGPTLDRALKAIDDLSTLLLPQIMDRVRQDFDVIKEIQNGDTTALESLRATRADMMTLMIAICVPPLTDPSKVGDIFLDSDVVSQVSKQVAGLFLAGYVTTAPIMVNCVKEMYDSAHILHSLQAEQASIPKLTLEAVSKEMPLLDSFMHEVMRLYPSVLFLSRRANKATNICGHRAKKDELIMCDIWASQRDAKHFADPETLHMDRFVVGSKVESSKKSLILFSSINGPHYCLGANLARMELKTTLALLLREYELGVVPRKSQDYVELPHVRPKDGLFASSCTRKASVGTVAGSK